MPRLVGPRQKDAADLVVSGSILVGLLKEGMNMSIELSDQHLGAVAKGQPFRFITPETNNEYVVIRADLYDRAKELLAGDDVAPETMYPLLAEIAPEDWEDPSVYGITPKS
jgi:hypothetical protein